MATPLDFPNAPTTGQSFSGPNGAFSWDGIKWVPSPSSGLFVPEAPSDGNTYGRKNGTWNSVDAMVAPALNDIGRNNPHPPGAKHMTATVISNVAPFGLLTNDTVADLYTVAAAIARLSTAVSTAASGYEGTPGTEYEDGTNFGVAADPASPGTKGSDYAYAIGELANAWNTFWAAASAYIQQLDNGVRNPG